MSIPSTFIIPEVKGKCVLVAPLNWGLGHATRCIPIIWELKERGHQVIVAASGPGYSLLKQEFPTLTVLKIPGMTITYTKGKEQMTALFKQVPKALYNTYREYQAIQKIVRQNNVNTIISDNRFGCFSSRVHCIYMTHQLHIKLPQKMHALEPVASFIHQLIIDQYDACWIPDYEEETRCLSGKLSHQVSLPECTSYIGPLSRFSVATSIIPESEKEITNQTFDAIAVISGPEPQRSLFERRMRRKFQKKGYKALIIQGKPRLETSKKKRKKLEELNHSESSKQQEYERIQQMPHLSTPALLELLLKTPRIYCRAGYSTIMDLHAIGKTAYLYPTPGQPEQEYLASYTKRRMKHSEKN